MTLSEIITRAEMAAHHLTPERIILTPNGFQKEHHPLTEKDIATARHEIQTVIENLAKVIS